MTTPMRNPDVVYKIVTRAAFEAARGAGEFPQMPIDLKDGFIHFSTATQLRDTLRLHFAGQSDLVVFAVNVVDMGAGLRWEVSRGGELFPHHYGPLSTAAIGRQVTVSVAADGSVGLPDWIQ
jgi:uncharacterized protein (DUF952 family)